MGACRQTGGGTVSERQQKIYDVLNQEYQYHATRGTSVFSIYEQGLKPNKGIAGVGVYFAPSAEEAKEWTAETSTGGTFVMRVKTKALKDKYAWGLIDETQSYADKKIAAKDIEVQLGKDWVSLAEFVDKRRVSYRAWKASQGKK